MDEANALFNSYGISPSLGSGPDSSNWFNDSLADDWAQQILQDFSPTSYYELDVRLYGQWMRDEAEKRIGHLYPKAILEDGSEANVIAWI